MTALSQVVLITILLLTVSCQENSSTQNFKHLNNNPSKTLIMGVSSTAPPFAYISNGELMGFDIDLAQLIAKELGYKLQFIDINFDKLIPYIQSNKIDFSVSSLTYTNKRSENITFSTKYLSSFYAIVYKKNSPIKTTEHLNNKVIITLRDSTSETFLKNQLKLGRKIRIITTPRGSFLIKNLRSQKFINGALTDHVQAKTFTKQYKDFAYSILPYTNHNEGYAIAFPKNSQLVKPFNQVLIKLRDSGKLDELKGKWFKHPV